MYVYMQWSLDHHCHIAICKCLNLLLGGYKALKLDVKGLVALIRASYAYNIQREVLNSVL